MRFKSKKLESICKEFARELFKGMSEEDLEYALDNSFIMMSTKEFNTYLVPATVGMERELLLASRKRGWKFDDEDEENTTSLLIKLVDEALEELAGI